MPAGARKRYKIGDRGLETRRFRSVPRSFPRLLSGLGNFMFLFGTLGRAWRPFPPSKTSGPPKRPSALRPRPCDLFSTRERSRSPARDTPVHGNPHSAGEHEPLPLGAFRFQGLLTSGARLWALSPVRSIPERHWAPRAPAPSVPRAGLLAPLAGAECISFMVLASHLLLPRKRDPSSTPCRWFPTHARRSQHRPERSRKGSCSSITFL